MAKKHLFESTLVGSLLVGVLVCPVWAWKPERYASLESQYEHRSFERLVNFANPNPALLGVLTTNTNGAIWRVATTHRAGGDVSRNLSLHLEVPHEILHANGGTITTEGAPTTLDSTISGLKDIVIRPAYRLEDPDSPDGGHVVSLTFNLGQGRSRIDPLEQQVMSFFVQESGLGFLSPLFSRGFGARLDNRWNVKWGKKQEGELALAYTYTGAFASAVDIPTRIDPSDEIFAALRYRKTPNPKLRRQVAVTVKAYSDQRARNVRYDTDVSSGLVAFIPGQVKPLQKNPCLSVNYAVDWIQTPRQASRLALHYATTGAEDYFTTTSAVIRKMKIGDAYSAMYETHYRARRRDIVKLGASLGRLEKTTVQGVPIDGSERTHAMAFAGYDYSPRRGLHHGFDVALGLGPDSPEVVAKAQTLYKW
ncbi:MAG: hypothetical protein HY815_14685 [Candidatus Riflebacteria bacterium]|nr:hypothetical protein [Candidatus Riflebacteria bacterium]